MYLLMSEQKSRKRRDNGIIAYGEPEDRLRLAAIARYQQGTGSAAVIGLIRARYVELFGDLDPRATE